MRTTTLNLTARFVLTGALAMVLAGCSMGPMFGGGSQTAQTNAELANSSATPTQIAATQANVLPAIATQCPPIKVRPGGEAMFYYGGGKVGTPSALNYQGVIEEATRNCIVTDGRITVNMGAVGRVLLGPAGKQTNVKVPLRFAIERNGQAVYSEKFNIEVALSTANQSQEFVKVINDVAIPYLAGDDITIWVGFDTRR